MPRRRRNIILPLEEATLNRFQSEAVEGDESLQCGPLFANVSWERGEIQCLDLGSGSILCPLVKGDSSGNEADLLVSPLATLGIW